KAIIAFSANVFSVILLQKYRNGDANVRSVWLCSRNDAIGNFAVLMAAGVVYVTQSQWPDLIVAFLMAALFLHSATLIIRQALAELRYTRAGYSEPSVCELSEQKIESPIKRSR
ncbi:MAG: cation transporter, partial [Candidatus Thiodiazotropha lotti]